MIKPSGTKPKSCDIMFPRSKIMISGGTFITQNRTSRGMDILLERVATGAFHNSKELYDAPKYHPHTRVAVLDDIMQWANESSVTRADFMMWLFGPAGAGKSAIAKRIAEIATERDLLIADFFFSRTSSTRNTTDRLIATLAYQLALSIPGTRSHIEDVIERDPAIFNKNIQTQFDALLITPLQSFSSTQIFPSKKLIIIDGLDECNDSKAQVAILEAISRCFIQHNPPFIFLIASRPEPDLVTSFNCKPLKYIHRRLALDDTYQPDNDIRLFFSDKFENIKHTHLLRSTIPISWPSQQILNTLVKKSSGQFIYASTVVKFVESSYHQPPARLNIILGISPPGRMNPFAELDALYNHLLSSVDDIRTTLRVLSFYVMTPEFASDFSYVPGPDMKISPELFLSLEPGHIQLALINLSSIITYDELSGEVEILHASLVDFLSDKRRSTTFYIDKTSACVDFTRRILQCVKGPDGIRAGNIHFFRRVHELWTPDVQLQSDILNFDLDAFINASIGCYSEECRLSIPGCTIEAFEIWKKFLTDAGLESRDKKEVLDRLNKSFKLRLQIYQSHWRLQLLLTLAIANFENRELHTIPFCRYVDIFLEMDDHHLHLIDQRALDLRHTYSQYWVGIRSHIDGDAYASAALYCMRFLSNPPKYSEREECPEMGPVYAEWKATCRMTLEILIKVLQLANTVPELVQFISKHDIHPAVQKKFSANRIWEVNEIILEFLNRANVSTTIQRSRNITDQLSGDWVSEADVWSHGYDEERIKNPYCMQRRLDLCCSNVHRYNS